MKHKKAGIYLFENSKEEKGYIGSSVDIDRRGYNHRTLLRKGTHYNKELQEAWNRCGEEAFTLIQLDSCVPEIMPIIESGYIEEYSEALYNSSDDTSRPNNSPQYGKNNGMFGKRHSVETKQQMSNNAKGNSYAKGAIRSINNRTNMSERAKLRVGDSNPFFGKHHSQETRAKLREAMIGTLPTNCRKVSIDGVTYVSVTEASRKLGTCPATIIYRINSDNPKYSEYKYLN